MACAHEIAASACATGRLKSFNYYLCNQKGRGAYRVHGGGFAGTVQAFVPLDILDSFKYNMEKSLGKDCCHILNIRPYGGVRVQ